MDSTDKVVMFLDEARALGLTVLPPDVNASNFMFEAIDDTTIRYGLGAVQGVGRGPCEAIPAQPGPDGPFPDPPDLRPPIESAKFQRPHLGTPVHAAPPRRPPPPPAHPFPPAHPGHKAPPPMVPPPPT